MPMPFAIWTPIGRLLCEDCHETQGPTLLGPRFQSIGEWRPTTRVEYFTTRCDICRKPCLTDDEAVFALADFVDAFNQRAKPTDIADAARLEQTGGMTCNAVVRLDDWTEIIVSLDEESDEPFRLCGYTVGREDEDYLFSDLEPYDAAVDAYIAVGTWKPAASHAAQRADAIAKGDQ